MNLRQLRVFREVVREGSATRAAAKLFITQPSVTIQVKRLEEMCGLKLLERLNGKFVTTTAGASLYAAAIQILDASDEIRARLNNMKAGTSGTVRLGAATGALYYISHTLKWLNETYSDLEIILKVATSEEISNVAVDNEVDLGIIWLPDSSAALTTCALMRAPYAMVVSPRHPLARCTSIVPQALDGQKFIVAVKGSGSHALFNDEVLKRLRIRASIGMEFNHTEPIKQAAEANLGIGMVPTKSAEKELAEGRLVSLPVSGMRLSRELALAYHAWKRNEPPIGLVCEILVRDLGLGGALARPEQLAALPSVRVLDS